MYDETDPTRPLRDRSTEQLQDFVDDHLIMALHGAHYVIGSDRKWTEDYIRDRLAIVSERYPTRTAVEIEDGKRKHARLRSMLGQRVAANHG